MNEKKSNSNNEYQNFLINFNNGQKNQNNYLNKKDLNNKVNEEKKT